MSAQIYTSYSSWLDVQVKALHDKDAPGMYGGASVRSEAEALNGFYREQAAMDVYAVRKWQILCLGFPVALTVAFFLARFAGWLEHINLSQGIAGLGLVYIMPGPALYLFASVSCFPALSAVSGASYSPMWILDGTSSLSP